LLSFGCEFLLSAVVHFLLVLGLRLSFVQMGQQDLLEVQLEATLQARAIVLVIEGLLGIQLYEVFS